MAFCFAILLIQAIGDARVHLILAVMFIFEYGPSVQAMEIVPITGTLW